MAAVKPSTKDMQKVTIYVDSDFGMGIRKIEGFLYSHGIKRYAQYHNAPFVNFVQKGKRKLVGIQKTYKPYLLIVDGWNQPEPDGMFKPEPISEAGFAKVYEGRYSSFDDRWDSDNDAKIAAAGVKVIADYRHTSGFDPMDRGYEGTIQVKEEIFA